MHQEIAKEHEPAEVGVGFAGDRGLGGMLLLQEIRLKVDFKPHFDTDAPRLRVEIRQSALTLSASTLLMLNSELTFVKNNGGFQLQNPVVCVSVVSGVCRLLIKRVGPKNAHCSDVRVNTNEQIA